MLKFVNRYTIITIGVLSASFLSADDKFNDLINDENENISSRTTIDYNIKVVQFWRDSVWVNRAKKITGKHFVLSGSRDIDVLTIISGARYHLNKVKTNFALKFRFNSLVSKLIFPVNNSVLIFISRPGANGIPKNLVVL